MDVTNGKPVSSINNISKLSTPGKNTTRIRELLNQLEEQSKKHIEEVNKIHEHYRFYMIKYQDLEEQVQTLK